MRQPGRIRAAALALGLALLPLGRTNAEEPLALELPRALESDLVGQGIAPWAWLPSRQMPDGRWSAMDWDRWCLRWPRTPKPRLSGRADKPHDVAVTGLALWSFLANGYTPRGRYPFSQVVARGLELLTRTQATDGSLAPATEPDRLAAHALATIALTEAFGMTGSVLYRKPCRRALDHLLAARGPNGVWQHPGSAADDALATFWAASALHNAAVVNADAVERGQTAPIPIDTASALLGVVTWLDERTDARGIVRASPDAAARGAGTLVLTAAGAQIRLFAGADPRQSAVLRAALDHLGAHPPTASADLPESSSLYAYIGSLAMFQAGGKAWDVWRTGIERSVIDTQNRSPGTCGLRGSWRPRGAWTKARGRVAATALGSLTLEPFYRYDRVFGAPGKGGTPRLQIREAGLTWTRSTLPGHAARMTLAGGGSLPIDAAHIRADVHGVRAQVVLDLFVTNSGTVQSEGVLDLRLPDGAAPYYLAFGEAQLEKVPRAGAGSLFGTDVASLHRGATGPWGQVREARMAPVARATQAFETIVRKRKDPALLTWAGAGVFRLRVFPLLPTQQHRIVVAYEVDLMPVGDEAELVLPLPLDLNDVQVAVRAPGATWTASPEAPLRDGVRTWDKPEGDAIHIRVPTREDLWLVGSASDGREYTAGWVRPDVPELPREGSSHASFLVDVSQSVAATSMRVWQQLVPAILEANRDRIATFTVTFFDMRTRPWRAEPTPNTPANVRGLREALAALEPGGATDLAGALASVRDTAPGTDVFLFTDGNRNWGAVERAAVLEQVGPKRPVFAYATGLRHEDRDMLAAITQASAGALFTVLGPAEVAGAARAHRSHPWQIVEAITVSGVSDLLVAGNPATFYPGQRLRLAGRGLPPRDAVLFLSLRRGAQQHALRVPVSQPNASPMAARAYGHAGVQRLEEAGATCDRLARDYATHFRVVRKRCALLMLESEADYKRFGLDETGHAERVAAQPVLPAVFAAPAVPQLVPKSTAPTPAEFARLRKLPNALVTMLQQAGPAALSLPFDAPLPVPDPVLRTLGSAFDEDVESGALRLALQAYADGLWGHAFHVLYRTADPKHIRPTSEWLMARAAARANRPLLALLGYEAALGDTRTPHHGEVYWVIAADYERYLRRLLAQDAASEVSRFARARMDTLAHWRKLMGRHAPSRAAPLVVLHMPYDWRDRATIQIRGPDGLPEPNGPLPSVRDIPQQPAGTRLQMTTVRTLPTGPWSVHLLRPESDDMPASTRRSLVIVIRDWGSPTERIALMRSVGPHNTGPLLNSE